jgi:hypothetical protein
MAMSYTEPREEERKPSPQEPRAEEQTQAPVQVDVRATGPESWPWPLVVAVSSRFSRRN